MKFFCDKNTLMKGINIAQKGTASKTTLPILEGILIEATRENIKLTSNDLELGIEIWLKAKIIEEGVCVIDSRMFGEIIRKLPQDSMIDISLEEGNILAIKCEGSLYKLLSMNPEDFPRLPEVDVEKTITIKQNILKDMIRQTIFAVGTDENRPIFTGCLVEVTDGYLNIVGVDGFRLALRRHLYEGQGEKFYAIIPGKTLSEILKILENSEAEVKIGISKNQALVELENCKIVSRVLEGEFLNYKAAIPLERDIRIRVNKDDLLAAFERIYLLTRDERKYPSIIRIQDDKLIITCDATVGAAKEEIKIDNEGGELEIGFNPKYFVDALKAIDDKEVFMDFGTSVAPCVIRPIEGEEFVHMILPVRIRGEEVV